MSVLHVPVPITPRTPPRNDDAAMPRAVAALTVRPIHAGDYARWDAFVREQPDGTYFHTMTWMLSVRDAFKHQPIYLAAWRDDQIVAALPMFRVNSLFGGRMLVSVPYAVAGGVVGPDDEAARALLDHALAVARNDRVSMLDLRSSTARFESIETVDRYDSFARTLPADPDDIPGWLPRKARAAARTAESKHGLISSFSRGHLRKIWRLYGRSMRRLGSVAYPFRFFEELLERNPANTFVQTVEHQERIIAGLVSFRFKDTYIPYFNGYDERFGQYGTNNFLYARAMRHAVEIGCTTFDFGRTRKDNVGSHNFKRFHGFAPSPLGYQRWVAGGCTAPNLTPSNPRIAAARRIWRYLPLPVCNRIGGWASRHLPG